MTEPGPLELTPEGDLAGRKALVIGAETLVGGAIARTLGAAGADVALAVMRADEGVLTARKLQHELREGGRQAMTYVMDVTLGRNVQVTTRQVAKELAGLDLVVSAPDEAFLAPLAKTSEAQLAQTMTLNGYAHAYAARAAFGEFGRGGRGHFLLVTHVLGKRPVAGAAAYSLACAAALAVAGVVAVEHTEPGVAVATLLRGTSAFPAGAAEPADLAAAIEAADETEAEALGRLAATLAARDADAIRGRVFTVAEAPVASSAPAGAGS